MRDDLEQRIRERAFGIWLDEGRPEGRDKIHWDKASELVAKEDNQKSPLRPADSNLGPTREPVEPSEAAGNRGELPTQKAHRRRSAFLQHMRLRLGR